MCCRVYRPTKLFTRFILFKSGTHVYEFSKCKCSPTLIDERIYCVLTICNLFLYIQLQIVNT